MTTVNWGKHYALCLVPLAFFYVGRYLEYVETQRMTMFRDKSKLYGPRHKPGDPPSWPKPNFPCFF